LMRRGAILSSSSGGLIWTKQSHSRTRKRRRGVAAEAPPALTMGMAGGLWP
jgi:hypothetical protein